ncbi:hypothetical protein VPH35_110826 [Triticum aestivum]
MESTGQLNHEFLFIANMESAGLCVIWRNGSTSTHKAASQLASTELPRLGLRRPSDLPLWLAAPLDLHSKLNPFSPYSHFCCPMTSGLVSRLYWLGQLHPCARGFAQSTPRAPPHVLASCVPRPQPCRTNPRLPSPQRRTPPSSLLSPRRYSASLLSVV